MPDRLLGIRIARVSTVPFALVTQLSGQIEYLSNAGAYVVAITSRGPGLERLASRNVRIENIEIPRSISLLKDFLALILLFRCFRRNRFHIVHSTTPKAGLLCALAGFAARVPIRLHTFTGQPWVDLKGLVRFVARAADWLIGRLNSRNYTDSESQRQFLISEGLLQAGKVGVIGKGSLAGVDLKRFDSGRWSEEENRQLRNELGISKTARVILFVGRITMDKGVNELLKAFDALLKKTYDADLLLVGPMDDERGGGVKVDHLDRVHPIGYTDCPERYMAISDFLCLPSYREGFGTVVIEAAAMGLPTVGTRIYGLSDAIEEGVTGLLAQPKDAQSLMSPKKLHRPFRCASFE
jgi:glycosyltransferase involved in cell wall biosynthesis